MLLFAFTYVFEYLLRLFLYNFLTWNFSFYILIRKKDAIIGHWRNIMRGCLNTKKKDDEIRKMAERSSAAQTLSVLGDDLFYGRVLRQRKYPLD